MADWSLAVVEEKYVLHTPTGIAAKAVEYYAPGEYKNPEEPEDAPPIMEPVLKLADGNAFLARAESIVLLDAHEHRLYRNFQAALGQIIKAGVDQLRSDERDPHKVLAMLLAAIKAQTIALAPAGEGGG